MPCSIGGSLTGQVVPATSQARGQARSILDGTTDTLDPAWKTDPIYRALPSLLVMPLDELTGIAGYWR